MAYLPSIRALITDNEVAGEAPLTETFFKKLGSALNYSQNKQLASLTFDQSTTFNIPAYVETAIFYGVGAGGGGGGGGAGGAGGTPPFGGGGGGGGGSAGEHAFYLIPDAGGKTLSITVGVGGSPGTAGIPTGQDGGAGGNGGNTELRLDGKLIASFMGGRGGGLGQGAFISVPGGGYGPGAPGSGGQITFLPTPTSNTDIDTIGNGAFGGGGGTANGPGGNGRSCPNASGGIAYVGTTSGGGGGGAGGKSSLGDGGQGGNGANSSPDRSSTPGTTGQVGAGGAGGGGGMHIGGGGTPGASGGRGGSGIAVMMYLENVESA